MPYPPDTLIECPVCGKKIYNYWEEPHLDVMGVFLYGDIDMDSVINKGEFKRTKGWFGKHQSAWKVLCGEPIKIDYEKMITTIFIKKPCIILKRT